MLRSLLSLLLIASLLAGLSAWLVSPEMAENWAFARNGTPESIQDARALLWLGRVAAPLLAIAVALGLSRWNRTERALHELRREFLAVTHCGRQQGAAGSLPTIALRVAVVAWLLLASVHWGAAARRVVREWPIYRFRSGGQVLPNMSESNRDVIRYLATATPEDARILAVSDQTLYFLSYYLWPREIYQRRHPDSEFTVPQPGRQLAAYRLSDLTDEDIAAVNPDYVLEYFEGPESVEPDRLLADRQWIEFSRRLHGDSAYVPQFNLRLRPIGEVQGQP